MINKAADTTLTITLTSGTNSGAAFTGSTGNDTFNADLVNEGGVPNVQTLNNNDALSGGAGIDTLNATIVSDVTPASLAGIEIVNVSNIDNGGAGSADIALTNAADLTTIKTSGNAEAMVISGVQTKLTGGLEISNNTQGLTVTTVATALSATNDALAVKLSSVTAGTLIVDTATGTNGYETITVESAGTAANTLTDLNDGAATSYTTLKVTGTADFTLGTAVADVVKTIDASAATGKVSVIGTTGDVDMTITGGSGDDTIDMVDEYEITDTIDGGGGTDTLRAASSDFQAVAAAISADRFKNVETIFGDTETTASINLTFFTGATTLKIAGNDGAGDTFTLASGNSLHLTADVEDGNANTTVLVAGTAVTDSVNLIVDVGVDVLGDGTEKLVFTGVETVNLQTASTAGTKNDFQQGLTITPTAGGTGKLVITGANEVDFGGTLTASQVDASALTGALTIAGTAASSNILGGTKVDTITGSASADVVSTGAGADVLTISGGNDIYTGGADSDTYKFGAAYDDGDDAITITDFTVGSGTDRDIISFDVSEMDGAVAGLVDNLLLANEVIGSVGAAGSNDSAVAFASNSLNIVTNVGFANVAAALAELKVENGGTDLEDIAVLFFNTTTSRAELFVTDTTANNTNDFKVVTFDNITTLVGMSGFAAENFTDF